MVLSRAALAAVLAVVAAVLVRPAPAPAQAVTFQADAGHTGYVSHGAPSPPLRRRWVVRLEDRVSFPVVAGGKVFVTTGPFERLGARVVAIDARSGRVVWTRDLSAEGVDSASLGYDAGRLFVTRNVTYPVEPSLLALDPADGRELWNSGDALHLTEGVPPVAAGGGVYIGGAGFYGIGIAAFRQADGAHLWTTGGAERRSTAVALSGDTAFMHTPCPPYLFRVRLADGAPLTSVDERDCGFPGTAPSVRGGRAYLHGDAGAGVYDAGSGARLGGLRADAPAVLAPRGVVVAPDARVKGELALFGSRLVARRGRRVLWRFRGDRHLDSAPLAAGRTVYVGSGTGRVFGVDLRSGRVRWRGHAGAPVPAPAYSGTLTGLAAAHGMLFVPARGRLVAFG